MARLYMSCTLCGRKQAHGLLSNASWAIVAVSGVQHRVCPTCREAHRDWEERARVAVVQLEDGSAMRFRGTAR